MNNENTKDKNKTTWLITGCSSGLGNALAKEVLSAGYTAVITSRKLTDVSNLTHDYPDTALALSLDVTDAKQVASVVAQAEERFGKIDVLVNNAGYGFRGAVEEASEEEINTVFNTNFFGMIHMIQAVLPGMRSRKSGTIMNLSSIGGRFAAPGSGYYSATKFAVEGMSDALRKEVGPLSIKVILIEPGAFRTDFAGRSLTQSKEVIADYERTAGQRRKEKDTSSGTQPGNPAKAAKVIIQVQEGEDVPFRLLLGSDAIKTTRAELENQIKEIDAWEAISITTDFTEHDE